MIRTVHGAPASPFVRKVLLCLELKGLTYTLDPVVPVDPSEDFLRISPLGKVPAYSDEQLSVADSSVICQYLEECHPEPSILPPDPVGRARARFIEEYSDTRGAEVFGGKLFLERVLKPRFFGEATDEAVVADNLANGIPPVNDYFESVLPSGDFYHGERPGLVDISLAAMLVNAMYADYRADAQRWPRLAAWFERMLAHPVLVARLSQEREMMGALLA